jgi:uncharacterized membrane protein YhaH (DUF805 family)|tara:strand:- start:497 stop:712 length:216 start_codon:yes stop_codon:yes gene_type:complete
VTPVEMAQAEAEKTFEMFIVWSKRVTIYAIIFLMVVVFGCNSGVETGPNKTGSQYNGESYSPMNLNRKDKK